jgi:TPR repeat protein
LGEPENYAEAMRWFKLAATHGSAEAQAKVGFMYGNAHGVELNFPESLRWYLMAAEQEYPAALSNLGFMFDHGQGVPMDSQKALMYYSKAAKKGDVNARNNRDIIEARIAKQQSNDH